ncbi:MAG: hypothetical protein A2469_03780 [Candidatus Magasanikbacteria bacterium RIFOXYC2_FULL_40_16]|uniref:SpoVT-AbrB domain-containing protein n=3 Tax=Candidatus Magasanikiibacteriota TaxID=1752731 RepID=A0A1F6NGV3_9BACT|nr:MAG: hypothetical protein A2224_00715 [Candidatus Magasanikbacteria bacterium RIFOXYA2_FULL_40_20]OGH83072.1 MAG: hypothetical protein A2373_00805 [Candidatus Magasanikbacteria bacterium RIFOXYB1_FULL_40_15]OGH86864.1 MAG: hypothetical protein A2301_04055 [Candidatus Magasanikbacteria bacterium RIFOXYB2_FULL_40_13]OGH87237.1 MAG: hypothetical protein A2206_03100 [Candidatus Magasanikbacteria bacterium RIFOXYA1_FULL_40_8]OGH89936.1 MAG: hypothetical protein A2469_03780 [Candidatus Magasanikba
MSRQRINKEQIRKIQNSKGSYFVSLPIDKVRELGWRNGQRIIIAKQGSKLIITDWKRKKKNPEPPVIVE